MNAKINCISTKVGDVPYLFNENRGLLIDGFDYLSISRALESFLKLEKATKDKIIKNAHEFVCKNLNEEDILNEWLLLINQG